VVAAVFVEVKLVLGAHVYVVELPLAVKAAGVQLGEPDTEIVGANAGGQYVNLRLAVGNTVGLQVTTAVLAPPAVVADQFVVDVLFAKLAAVEIPTPHDAGDSVVVNEHAP